MATSGAAEIANDPPAETVTAPGGSVSSTTGYDGINTQPNVARNQESAQASPTLPSSQHTNHERIPSSGTNPGATTTRPTTGGSRTHVPSVTSRAFFAPMSSQRLQAHRGQRPNSHAPFRSRPSDDYAEDRSATNRNST